MPVFILLILDFVKDAEFGASQRGTRVLVYCGYYYVRDAIFAHTTTWRCAFFKKYKCKSRATTKMCDGIEKVKLTHNIHTHEPDEELFILEK